MPTHLENLPIIQMACIIAKKTQHSRRGYLYKTEDKEGDLRKVLDEDINLLDNSEDDIDGGVTIANDGTQGGGSRASA